jgi:hypothetical protein
MLTVNKGSSTGTGTISGSMINCGSTCTSTSATYSASGGPPTVTLTATPDASSTFTGWVGGGCTGTAPCTMTLPPGPTTVTGTFTLKQIQISVAKVDQGAATGTVASNPAGFTCDPTCLTSVATVSYGGSITLTASSSSKLYGFAGWAGACSGTSDCVLTNLTADTTVRAQFTPYNMIFVTPGTKAPGGFGGITNVDAYCQSFVPGGSNATGSVLPAGTTYRAFLLPVGVSSTMRLTKTDGSMPRGWIRPDGTPFMDQIMDSSMSTRFTPRLGADGVDIGAATPLAATNSDYYGNAPTSGDCGGYATTTGNVGTGMPSAGAGAWLNSSGTSCASAARYYCLGIDYTVPLSYPKAVGRAAFLTSGTWNPGPGLGLGSADALCQKEAANANLPSANTFLAAMSTTTQAAAARFSINGLPWVRTDGIPLASTAAGFFDTTVLLSAPLNMSTNVQSVYQTYWVWTGSATPAMVGTAANTCTDWTSASAAVTPIAGVSGYTDANRWNVVPNTYSNPFCGTFPVGHIYCLQP